MEAFEDRMRRGGVMALEEMGRFFMQQGSVYESLRRILGKLDELGIAYAIAGGMSLGAHGYVRATTDVVILVTEAGLSRIHDQLDGLGYVPPFSGSKNLRDTETDVRIEFLVSGQFPGDGKPKPVSFPDPEQVAITMDGIRFLRLEALIELKLASGLTGGINRMKDTVDVIEVIKVANLTREFGDRLNEYVRGTYQNLWDQLHS